MLKPSVQTRLKIANSLTDLWNQTWMSGEACLEINCKYFVRCEGDRQSMVEKEPTWVGCTAETEKRGDPIAQCLPIKSALVEIAGRYSE